LKRKIIQDKPVAESSTPGAFYSPKKFIRLENPEVKQKQMTPKSLNVNKVATRREVSQVSATSEDEEDTPVNINRVQTETLMKTKENEPIYLDNPNINQHQNSAYQRYTS